MSIQLPSIDIVFKQLASTFVERSERGNVILIVKDDTDITFSTKDYNLETEVVADTAKYTATNLQYIKDTMVGLPNKVSVIRIATTDTIDVALTLANNYSTGWIGIAEGTQTEHGTLSTWVKTQRAVAKTMKGVVYNPLTAPDSEGVVSIDEPTVIFNDDRGSETGEKYVASLLGFLAGANVEKGTTYLELTNLTSVSAKSDTDVNTKLQAGKMQLINDEGICRIALGINSLTTLGADKTEDFKDITVIETQDLIMDDIRKTYKTSFIGKYKNKTDYQMIFISAVNSYLKELANEDVLDSNYNNTSYINAEAQKNAWIAVNPDAVNWSEATVKNMAFKKKLFLGGNIKILQTMTDLSFTIVMA